MKPANDNDTSPVVGDVSLSLFNWYEKKEAVSWPGYLLFHMNLVSQHSLKESIYSNEPVFSVSFTFPICVYK